MFEGGVVFGGVVAAVQHLVSADPARCDSPALAELVATSGQVRSWLDAYDVRLAQRAADLAAAGTGSSPSDVLAGGGRWSGRDAAQAARRADTCGLLPDVHAALAAGQVSAGHVDAITRTARALDDTGRTELVALQPTLVDKAAGSSVEAFGRDMDRLQRLLSTDDGLGQLERNRRNRNLRRWRDRHTGVCHTHLELDDETDAKVAAALDAALAAAKARPQDPDVTFDQLQADALVDLITRPAGASASAPAGRPVPEVIVLIDLDTLRTGLHDHAVAETADGHPLPVATIRRMCCDATIIPVTLDNHGATVDIGREQRVATRHQRRALRAMHTTCAHPGCPVRFECCQIHHVTPWEHSGPTNLDNLTPLCSTHHHLVHEGAWTLTLRSDRTIQLRRPDDTMHHDATSVTRAPDGVATHPPPPPPPRPAQPDHPEIAAHPRHAAQRTRDDAAIQAQRAAAANAANAAINRNLAEQTGHPDTTRPTAGQPTARGHAA